GIDPDELPDQYDRDSWPEVTERLSRAFATRTRQEWVEIFTGTDACVAPVLAPAEVADHPHHTARGTFVDVAGVVQPAPAPRLSRTPAAAPGPPARPGEHSEEALRDWGLTADEVARLRNSG